MRDSFFDPTTLTVNANAAVAFQNNSGILHHVVFDAPLSAKAVGTGNAGDIGDILSGTVSRTWSVAGKYDFHCTIHAGMAGSVTVL
jgi:plastocyanin